MRFYKTKARAEKQGVDFESRGFEFEPMWLALIIIVIVLGAYGYNFKATADKSEPKIAIEANKALPPAPKHEKVGGSHQGPLSRIASFRLTEEEFFVTFNE